MLVFCKVRSERSPTTALFSQNLNCIVFSIVSFCSKYIDTIHITIRHNAFNETYSNVHSIYSKIAITNIRKIISTQAGDSTIILK